MAATATLCFKSQVGPGLPAVTRRGDKIEWKRAYPPASRGVKPPLLENVREGRFRTKLRIVDSQVLQEGGADGRHGDAMKIHAGLDSRSPGDEGSLEPLPEGQIAVISAGCFHLADIFAAGKAAEAHALARLKRQLGRRFRPEIPQP